MSPEDFAARCLPSDCIVWTGALNAKAYGTVRHPETGEVVYAHRLAWEIAHGPIPDGLTVDHKDCRTRSCVRLDHLELIPRPEHSAKDNRRRHALARAG